MMPGAMKALNDYQNTVNTMRNVAIAGLVIAAVVIAVVIYKKTHK